MDPVMRARVVAELDRRGAYHPDDDDRVHRAIAEDTMTGALVALYLTAGDCWTAIKAEVRRILRLDR
jgi:hypothetical protein